MSAFDPKRTNPEKWSKDNFFCKLVVLLDAGQILRLLRCSNHWSRRTAHLGRKRCHLRVKHFMAVMLSLAFMASASAQAPQVEKNVSMKMALMIIEGTLEQCTKDGYKVSVVVVDKGGNVAASVPEYPPFFVC